MTESKDVRKTLDTKERKKERKKVRKKGRKKERKKERKKYLSKNGKQQKEREKERDHIPSYELWCNSMQFFSAEAKKGRKY